MTTTTEAAIAAAWAKHAQRPKASLPAGCGGFALLQGPELMAELGFRQAVSEVLDIDARQATDVQMLEAAVKVTGDALNDLLAACHGPDGEPKTPDKKEVMRARSMLPPRYSYALKKKA